MVKYYRLLNLRKKGVNKRQGVVREETTTKKKQETPLLIVLNCKCEGKTC